MCCNAELVVLFAVFDENELYTANLMPRTFVSKFLSMSNCMTFIFSLNERFIQANVETNVKQKEEQSKRAIPGVTKQLAALRHAQGAYLIAR
jgi:hypothetical protein